MSQARGAGQGGGVRVDVGSAQHHSMEGKRGLNAHAYPPDHAPLTCAPLPIRPPQEKERRKRKPGPVLVPGLCLPKALAPVLPIYLGGVLQVRWCMGVEAAMRGRQGPCQWRPDGSRPD